MRNFRKDYIKNRPLVIVLILLFIGISYPSFVSAENLRVQVGQKDTKERIGKTMVSIDIVEPDEYEKYADIFEKIAEEESKIEEQTEDWAKGEKGLFYEMSQEIKEAINNPETLSLLVAKDLNGNVIGGRIIYEPEYDSNMGLNITAGFAVVRDKYKGNRVGIELNKAAIIYMLKKGHEAYQFFASSKNKVSIGNFAEVCQELGLTFKNITSSVYPDPAERKENVSYLIILKPNTNDALMEEISDMEEAIRLVLKVCEGRKFFQETFKLPVSDLLKNEGVLEQTIARDDIKRPGAKKILADLMDKRLMFESIYGDFVLNKITRDAIVMKAWPRTGKSSLVYAICSINKDWIYGEQNNLLVIKYKGKSFITSNETKSAPRYLAYGKPIDISKLKSARYEEGHPLVGILDKVVALEPYNMDSILQGEEIQVESLPEPPVDIETYKAIAESIVGRNEGSRPVVSRQKLFNIFRLFKWL